MRVRLADREILIHPPLVILGYSEAAIFVRQIPMPEICGILSIHGSREFGVEFESDHRLDLCFDDVEVPANEDSESLFRQSARRRWAAENGLTEVPPTEADAAKIIAFAHDIAGGDRLLLCHCFGGMSRGPAAALICLAAWLPQVSPDDLVSEVLRIRHGATPHLGLVGLADTLLDRRGTLVTAVRRVRN